MKPIGIIADTTHLLCLPQSAHECQTKSYEILFFDGQNLRTPAQKN
jgi:hypothetical protein